MTFYCCLICFSSGFHFSQIMFYLISLLMFFLFFNCFSNFFFFFLPITIFPHYFASSQTGKKYLLSCYRVQVLVKSQGDWKQKGRKSILFQYTCLHREPALTQEMRTRLWFLALSLFRQCDPQRPHFLICTNVYMNAHPTYIIRLWIVNVNELCKLDTWKKLQ